MMLICSCTLVIDSHILVPDQVLYVVVWNEIWWDCDCIILLRLLHEVCPFLSKNLSSVFLLRSLITAVTAGHCCCNHSREAFVAWQLHWPSWLSGLDRGNQEEQQPEGE
jgi:hypothetical protein